MKLEDTLFRQSRGRVSLEAHVPEVSGPQAWWNLEVSQLERSARGPWEGSGEPCTELLVLAVFLG